MRLRLLLSASLFVLVPLVARAQEDAPSTTPEQRAEAHATVEWQTVAPHLPDPKTATAKQLEVAADVLHARRFPDDALDYYSYALARGGDVSSLLNKMGVIRLELRQNNLARTMFLQTVRARKTNAQAWNNLGAAEYAVHNYKQAINDYQRAAKLDKTSAVYHSNLGLAYFELDQMEDARVQLSLAVRMDPSIMQARPEGGMTAHVLGSKNYPALCFEMARVYGRRGELEAMRHWLAKASEGGYDVREKMSDDVTLSRFLKDPELQMMLSNAALMRKRAVASMAAPGLGDATKIVSQD